MKFILDGVTVGAAERADAYDPMVTEADKGIHQQVKENTVQAWATYKYINFHVTDWTAAQQEESYTQNGFPPIIYRISNISWETMS